MPLIKRGVEPVHLSRGIVSSLRNYAETQHITISNELECVTNNTLAQVIRQLSSLSKNAEDIFGELVKEAGTILDRASALQNRIEKLNTTVTRLDSNVEPVSLQDINTKKAFKSRVKEEQQLFTKQTMPYLLLSQYTYHVDPPPPLDVLTPYRTDGKSASKIYSDPGFFFERWTEQMEKEIMKPKKNKERVRTDEGLRDKHPRPIETHSTKVNPLGKEYEVVPATHRVIPIAQDHISSDNYVPLGGNRQHTQQPSVNNPETHEQQQQQQAWQRHNTASNRSSIQSVRHDPHNTNSRTQTQNHVSPPPPHGGSNLSRPVGPAPPPPDGYNQTIPDGNLTPPPNYTSVVATDREREHSPINDYISPTPPPLLDGGVILPPYQASENWYPVDTPSPNSSPSSRNSFTPLQPSPVPKRIAPAIPPPPPLLPPTTLPPPPPPPPLLPPTTLPAPSPLTVGATPPPVDNGPVSDHGNVPNSTTTTTTSQSNSPVKSAEDNRGARSDLLQAIRDGKVDLKKVDPVNKNAESKRDVASILKRLEKIREQINASDSESDDSDDPAWCD